MSFNRKTLSNFITEINNNKPDLKLDLAYFFNQPNKEGYEDLLAAVKKSRRLDIGLAYTRIFPKEQLFCTLFCEAIEKAQELTIDLTGLEVLGGDTPNFLSDLFNAIKKNPNIKVNLSDLKWHKINKSEFTLFCELLETHPHLDLVLNKFNFQEKIFPILSAIKKQEHPIKINLSNTESYVFTSNAKVFDELCGLFTNSKGLDINLENCGLHVISESARLRLLDAIGKSNHLTINLSHNHSFKTNPSQTVFEKICDALITGNNLKLDLTGEDIDKIPNAYERLKSCLNRSTSTLITGNKEWDFEFKDIVLKRKWHIVKHLIKEGYPKDIVKIIAKNSGVDVTDNGINIVARFSFLAPKQNQTIDSPSTQLLSEKSADIRPK